MSDDLMPFDDSGEGRPASVNRGPYSSPHWLTQAGQVDRRNEAAHAITVREVTRQVERATLEVAMKLKDDMNRGQAAARLVTEQKYLLHRAAKESEVLAGDDPELRAKFGVLDDQLFSGFRQMGMGSRP